jgi:hypothetical protein
VDDHPEDLGDAREQQICTDGSLRRDPENENQQRRHQRAAAYAGETDNDADSKPG